MKFFRQESWSRLSFSSPGDFPDPGIKPGSPAWQADSLPSELQVVVVQLPSCVQLCSIPWTTARQACLFLTISWSLPRFTSIELVMPSNHLILCCPLLFLPPIFPSIRVFPKELALHIRWPKYWNFSFSNSLSPLRGDTIIPTSQMWKRRGRERNYLAPGHSRD